MAIVLPQGRFNNTSDRHIREFISKQARILAVVGLHGNTFKPHTGTKTSVLFVQKWNDDPTAGPLCPKAEDYPIFFAVSEKGGKDNSGEYVYVRTSSGQHKLDKNGHLIVDHDLHNHGGELPDGIAEAFIEWAKKEKLSFFPDAPFDEARYAALLKGAKVKFTIINYKEINKDFRIDAEFFKIDQLLSIEKIKLCHFSLIDEISSWVTQGPNPVFSDQGIPCLTGRNINKGMVVYENADYVNDYEYKNLSRYQLIPGDIIITLKGKGSIGKIGYVTEKRLSIFSRNIGIIRPRGINSGYLNLFLLCKYGKLLIEKGETGGTGQSTLATGYLKSIPVPRFSIENKIGEVMLEIERLRNASKESYSSAQNTIFSELGLLDWKPKHQLSFVRNFSEAEEAERMDAEYFHPSYDAIIAALKKTGRACSIQDVLSVCQRGKQPVYCDEGGVVVNSKHVRNGEVSIDDDNRKGDIASASVLIQRNDMLMNGTGVGTIGRCAPYLHDFPAIPDNHVTVLRTKKNDPVFLAIQLDSLVGQMQVKKFQKGSSGQIELYPDDIKKFFVWDAPADIQEEIRQKITESFTLRRQSKHLLECAKRAVEIAIEQDEQAAIDWLERETEEKSCGAD